MEAVKIYGLCLERLEFQISLAKKRVNGSALSPERLVLMECYNTGDVEDIIDIMELYDIDERTLDAVKSKLEELEYTVSVLLREQISFSFTERGHLGLYLAVSDSIAEEREETPSGDFAAVYGD
jgi:hypothetical protein